MNSILKFALCILASLTPLAIGQTYHYDDLGRMTRAIHPNGLAIVYQFDDGGNLIRMEESSVPAAPSITAIRMQSDTAAVVEWTDNTNNETGYLVQRRQLDSNTWEDLTTTTANDTTTIDQGLTPGIGYVYRVAATGSQSQSAYSAERIYLGSAPVVITDFRVLPTASSDHKQIQFATVVGLTYYLEAKPNISAPTWQPLRFARSIDGPLNQTVVTGSGGSLLLFLDANDTSAALRIRVE